MNTTLNVYIQLNDR